ncbi:NUDIX hydrolase [Hoeflea sp. YIM 152468]|uniref:NUDIX hydrolase n=1 Tax=Hoeflea sp. YIM 152468 TaxID=3031759 RepID=UPI0023DC4920|nr:NUDIX hydrolase [Hoeflea sp. YIM 152468]MDF1609839.1 NUDIX hydrolase [Hoeflea sp. YIM 152468]
MTAFDRVKQLLDLFRHSGKHRPRHRKKPKRQAAAVVFRGSGDTREILLITSRDTGRWIVPKGWIEADEDGAQAAVRETWEEAGIVGSALPDGPVGHYRYLKRRMRRGDAVCDVDVYLLELIEQKARWPEKGHRKRKWFPVAAAISLVGEIGLKDVMRDAFHSLTPV